MKTDVIGRDVIEAFEGCMLAVKGRPGLYTTYRDSVGVLTIGYGHTNLGNVPPRIVPGVIWTKEQCDSALGDDLAKSEDDVERILPNVVLTQAQLNALVSFEFNTGHLAASSIPAKLKAKDLDGAIKTLLLYNHAGGKVLTGLTRRRDCEAELMRGNIQKALILADIHVQSPDVVETALAVPDHMEKAA